MAMFPSVNLLVGLANAGVCQQPLGKWIHLQALISSMESQLKSHKLILSFLAFLLAHQKNGYTVFA